MKKNNQVTAKFEVLSITSLHNLEDSYAIGHL